MEPQERLKIARKKLNLTQAQIADGLGIKPANIRDIESGKVRFSTLHAHAIENVYKIDCNWLLTGIGEMFSKNESDKTEIRRDPVDIELLGEIIAGVESWLNDRELKLDSDSKAELISLLYDQFISDSGQYDFGTLERFMRLGTR